MSQNNELIQQTNLGQPINRDDLLFHLMSGKGKFIVLTLVLLETNESIKIALRKYIKKKSKIYPNVLFLYYAVRNDDFGKIWDMLPNDPDTYPRVYHLYDVDKWLGEVWNLHDKNTIENELEYSFQKLHKHYINFVPPVNDPTNKKTQQTQQTNQTGQQLHQQQNQQTNQQTSQQTSQQQHISEVSDEVCGNISGNEVRSFNQQPLQSQQFQKTSQVMDDKPQLDLATEKKKLIEKIMFIQKSGEEYKEAFAKDIQKRKRKEEKRREKEKEKERQK